MEGLDSEPPHNARSNLRNTGLSSKSAFYPCYLTIQNSPFHRANEAVFERRFSKLTAEHEDRLVTVERQVRGAGDILAVLLL